jgi:ribosome-associated protein
LALEEKKGESVLAYEMGEFSPVTDYYVIVNGLSTPHVKALSAHVQKSLKDNGLQFYRRSGDQDGGWIALDYFDVIIHIFSKELREYYAIEELWDQATSLRSQDL